MTAKEIVSEDAFFHKNTCTTNMLIASLQSQLLERPEMGDKPIAITVEGQSVVFPIGYIGELYTDEDKDERVIVIGIRFDDRVDI